MVGWRRPRSRWHAPIAMVEHARVLGCLCSACDISGGGVWCFLDVPPRDQYLPNAHQISDGRPAVGRTAVADHDVLETLRVLPASK